MIRDSRGRPASGRYLHRLSMPRNAIAVTLALAAGIFAAMPGSVAAGTVNVGSNGIDHAACGKRQDPCRSISQALSLARDGDQILVGPGRYSPAEEAAEPGFGCFCMIRVSKQVAIESTDGAEVTLLDAEGADLRAVLIEADGVIFGSPRRGFTVTRARREGVLLEGSVTNVRIAGNTATLNGSNGNNAFFIQGSNNIATKNVAQHNSRAGFGVAGSGQRVTRNVASNNLVGFEVTATGVFRHNSAVGNAIHGLDLSVIGQIEVQHNDFVENGGLGIWAKRATEVTENNIYGNNGSGNCGLQNDVPFLSAINNYWGAATGPGPDPADTVCDSVGSITTTLPFATRPFRVRSTPPY